MGNEAFLPSVTLVRVKVRKDCWEAKWMGTDGGGGQIPKIITGAKVGCKLILSPPQMWLTEHCLELREGEGKPLAPIMRVMRVGTAGLGVVTGVLFFRHH